VPITNDLELTAMMSTIASDVIKKVSKGVLSTLQEHIWEDTYGKLPNAWYYDYSGIPTFQFKNAFQFTEVEQKINEIVSELFYNWQSMDYDLEKFLHGSPETGDMREKLADILNVSGISGFSNKNREPYWDNFIGDMFDRGGLEKLFDVYMKREFGKHGIAIIKQ